MKNLFKSWFASAAKLTPEQSSRLAKWQHLQETDAVAEFEHARYVVVDVETTGLDLNNDTLISIGAVAVLNGKIALNDSFSIILQQSKISHRENILIHGISGSAQQEGVIPVDALLAFLDYLGKSPLVAFHVSFDETMIRRAMRQYLKFTFKHAWLDLAYLLPALWPERLRSHRSLDDWGRQFSINNDDRHNAVADALQTAQLLQVAISKAKQDQKTSCYDDLRGLERRFRCALEYC